MDQTMQQLHRVQVEIMQVIDTFCKTHRIPYSLYAGSLLGAVRHQGFIPWDDDLDICMHRSDYERFLKLWEEAPPSGYILQNKENSPRFGQSFSKIRKDHTTFLQAQKDAGQFHNGIFVDIFPIDRLPEGRRSQLLFYWDCMLYLLYTRQYVPPKGNPLLKSVLRLMLAIVPTSMIPAVRRRLLKRITRFSHRTDLSAVTTETLGALRTHYPAETVSSYTSLPFEDAQFLCFRAWDQHLRLKFGDYMQLPPEEERVWKHHPILIDFEHNYEELERTI